MNRTQLACYVLLASAFVLAGLLLSQLSSSRAASTAYADQVVNQGSFTFMTARTKDNEESLFVIDNAAARLLIVKTDFNRKRIRVTQSLDLARELTEPSRREEDRRGGYNR